MIPKVIHYVWVGGTPLGTLQKKCVASWRKYLPEYEFKLWNEETLPKTVFDHPYVQEMYRRKKWAFVADYVRFWALTEEGGIYLDTDTEVLKSFDALLAHAAFFGKTKDGVTASGVIGSIPHHVALCDIRAVYDAQMEYDVPCTSPQIVTDVLTYGTYPDVVVYDYRYFNPCDDGERCSSEKLALAYATNHWAESWVPHAGLRKIARRLGVMRIVKKIFQR